MTNLGEHGRVLPLVEQPRALAEHGVRRDVLGVRVVALGVRRTVRMAVAHRCEEIIS